MITIILPDNVAAFAHADRDGVQRDSFPLGVQGFDLQLPSLLLHFESEVDATEIAKMILRRMGEL